MWERRPSWRAEVGGWLRLFAAATAALTAVSGAEAQVPAQTVALRFDRLSVEDGLSGSVVQAVARDGVGFLWVGTQYGLDRYDGVRVRTFGKDEGLPLSTVVRAIAADPAVPGGLWVGTNAGLARYDPEAERLRPVEAPSERAGALAGAVLALLPDGAGVWVGTQGAGVARLDAGGGRPRPVAGNGGTSAGADTVRTLLAPVTTPGVLWVGKADGLAWLDVRRGSFAPRGLFGGRPVTALAEAGGAVWCATADSVLHRVDPATGRVTRSVRLSADVSALSPSRVRPPLLWVGTRGGGLLAVDGVSGTPAAVDGGGALERAHVVTLTEDGEGLLWVGTTGALFRADARGPRFSYVGHDPGNPRSLSAPAVLALYEAPSEPDVVWAGTVGGGLNRLDRRTGAVRAYFTAPGDPLSVVFAIHEDRGGRFWLGSELGALYLMDRATGRAGAYPLGPLRRNPVYQIYEAPSRPGVLWAATDAAGLVEFDAAAGTPRRRYSTASAGAAHLGNDRVWAVLEAPDEPGVLWVATEGAGLYRLDVARGSAEPVRSRSGCRIGDRLLSLTAGPDSTLWIGTLGEGLLRYDRRTGACVGYSTGEGLPSRDVAAVYLDGRGRVWMSTRTGGLSLFDPERGAFTTFSAADGLQGNVFYFPARHQAPSGELLFGGPGGFNAFHPDSVRVDPTPPRVVLTRLLVDGRPYPLVRRGGGFEPVRLRYDQRDLAFEFAALDLRDPTKNRYRIHLDGAGGADGWQSLGARAEARYPYLAPGRYTFRVAGTNADGYWSREAAALPFVIRPPFWRAWWFWTLAAGLVLGLVVGGYQYRIRQLVRLERTRRRIADDLHDDVGSRVSAIALRLDVASRSGALPEEERRRLAELARAAREVIDVVRDAVWFVDAGHDDLPALVARMEQAAEELLRGRPHAFERPDALPRVAVGMEARRHLYLLFREALHNAAKHGGNGPVTARVAVDGRRLRLEVADEGPGFDGAAVRRGRGLSTMGERAAVLGGTLAVDSAPGRGTTVRFEVDLRDGRPRWPPRFK